MSTNTPPVITGSLSLGLRQGESTPIAQQHLYFTDADVDDTALNVSFTVSNFTNVFVNFNGVPVTVDRADPNSAKVSSFSFTAYELRTGQISFTSTGAIGAPAGFDVIVEDGDEDGSVPVPSRFNFSVVSANDAPVMTGDRTATVNEGGSVVLTTADLSFTDPDDTASGVTFTVSNPLNGVVKVAGVAKTSFTGAQLQAGQVSFTHDGSETRSARFDVKVEDGNEDASTPINAQFNLAVTPVNDAPVLTGDRASTVVEGKAVVLTKADLFYTDADDIDTGVRFTVSAVTNGAIQIGTTKVTSFTAADLAAGKVSFVHNGSDTRAAFFDVIVEDGNEDRSVPVKSRFNLTVTPDNDKPVMKT